MKEDKFDIEKNLKKLESSPLFALSLGSKELFHSNFLYWLINAGVLGTKEDGQEITGRKLFCDIIQELSGIDINPHENWVARREKMNFDLSLWTLKTNKKGEIKKNKNRQVIDDRCILIIENKLKSVPNYNQIKEYKDKLIKGNLGEPKLVLLTLMENFPDKEGIKNEGCKIVSYRKLIKILKKEAETIFFKKDYYKELIFDYCSFVDSLCSLGEEDTDISINKSLMLNLDPEFNDLRILQLVQAIRVGELYFLLHKEFEKDKERYKDIKFNTGYGQNGGAFIEILYAPVRGEKTGRNEYNGKEEEKIEWKKSKGKVKKISHGFLHQTHRSIGVQIQADRYAHFVCPLDYVETPNKKISDEDKISQDKNWVEKDFEGFFFENNITFQQKFSEKGFKSNQCKNLTLLSFKGESKKGEYHPRFVYQYAIIPDRADYKFIVDQIVNDINYIINKYKNSDDIKINKENKS